MIFLADNYLYILTWLIFLPAIYYKSMAAIAYTLLMVIHPLIFSPDNVLVYALSAGIFSFGGMIACYYLRSDINDKIALYLYGLGIFSLLTNIVTAIMWEMYFDLGALNIVFAGASIASIIAIIAGGMGGHRDTIRDVDIRRVISSWAGSIGRVGSFNGYTK